MKQKTLATITTILILTLLFTSLATAYIPRATPQETPNKILPTNTVTGKAGIDLETEMAKRQVEDVQENDYITINTVDNNLNGKHKVTAAQDTDGDGWIDTITTQLVDINGNPRSGASNTRTITLYDVTYADGFTVASADGTRTSSHSQTSTYTGPSTSNQPVRAAEARANSDTTRSAPPSTPATNPSIIQPTSPEALPDLFAVQWADGIVGVATRDSTDTNKFNIYNNKGKLVQTRTAQEIQDMPASGISLHTITPGQTDNENMNTVTIPGDTSRSNFGKLRITSNTDGTYNLVQDNTFSNPVLARGRTSSGSTAAQPDNVAPESIPAPAPQQTLSNNPITPALPVADGTSQPAQPVADSTGGVAGASSATNAARTGTTTDTSVDAASSDPTTTPPVRRTSMPAPTDGPPPMIGGATTTVDLPPDTRIFYGTISTDPYTLEQTPSMQAPIIFVKNPDGSITAYDSNGDRYLPAESHPEDITPIKPIQQSSDIPADLASTWRQAGYIVQSTSNGQPQLIYDSWGRDNVLIGTIPDSTTSTSVATTGSETVTSTNPSDTATSIQQTRTAPTSQPEPPLAVTDNAPATNEQPPRPGRTSMLVDSDSVLPDYSGGTTTVDLPEPLPANVALHPSLLGGDSGMYVKVEGSLVRSDGGDVYIQKQEDGTYKIKSYNRGWPLGSDTELATFTVYPSGTLLYDSGEENVRNIMGSQVDWDTFNQELGNALSTTNIISVPGSSSNRYDIALTGVRPPLPPSPSPPSTPQTNTGTTNAESGTTSTSRRTTSPSLSDAEIRRMTDEEFETYINNQFTPLLAPPSASIGAPGTGTSATSPQTVTATIQNALRARGQDLVLTQDTRDNVAIYLETRQDHGDTIDPAIIQQTKAAPTTRPEPTRTVTDNAPATNEPVLTTPERAAAAGRTRLLNALHATTIPELQQLQEIDIAGGLSFANRKISLAQPDGTPQEYTITGAKLDANGKPLITVKDTTGDTLEFAPDNTEQVTVQPTRLQRVGAWFGIGDATPTTHTQVTPPAPLPLANAGARPADTAAGVTPAVATGLSSRAPWGWQIREDARSLLDQDGNPVKDSNGNVIYVSPTNNPEEYTLAANGGGSDTPFTRIYIPGGQGNVAQDQNSILTTINQYNQVDRLPERVISPDVDEQINNVLDDTSLSDTEQLRQLDNILAGVPAGYRLDDATYRAVRTHVDLVHETPDASELNANLISLKVQLNTVAPQTTAPLASAGTTIVDTAAPRTRHVETSPATPAPSLAPDVEIETLLSKNSPLTNNELTRVTNYLDTHPAALQDRRVQAKLQEIYDRGKTGGSQAVTDTTAQQTLTTINTRLNTVRQEQQVEALAISNFITEDGTVMEAFRNGVKPGQTIALRVGKELPKTYTIDNVGTDGQGESIITVKDADGNTLDITSGNTQQVTQKTGLLGLFGPTITYLSVPATQTQNLASAGAQPVDTVNTGVTLPTPAPQPAPARSLGEIVIAGITPGQYVTLTDTPNKNGAYKVTSVEDTNGDGTPDQVIAQPIDDNGNILPGPTTVQVQITPQDIETAEIRIEDVYPAQTPSTPVAASRTRAQIITDTLASTTATDNTKVQTLRFNLGKITQNRETLDPALEQQVREFLTGVQTTSTIDTAKTTATQLLDNNLKVGGPAVGVAVHVTAGAGGSTNPAATPADTPLATQPDTANPTTGTAPETDAAALINALTPPGQGAVPDVAFGTTTDTSVDAASRDPATDTSRRITLPVPADDPRTAVSRPDTVLDLAPSEEIFYGTISTNPSAPRQTPIMQTPIIFVRKSDGTITAYDSSGNHYPHAEANPDEITGIRQLQQSSDIPQNFAAGWIQAGYVMQDTGDGRRQLVYDSHGDDDVNIGTVPNPPPVVTLKDRSSWVDGNSDIQVNGQTLTGTDGTVYYVVPDSSGNSQVYANIPLPHIDDSAVQVAPIADVIRKSDGTYEFRSAVGSVSKGDQLPAFLDLLADNNIDANSLAQGIHTANARGDIGTNTLSIPVTTIPTARDTGVVARGTDTGTILPAEGGAVGADGTITEPTVVIRGIAARDPAETVASGEGIAPAGLVGPPLPDPAAPAAPPATPDQVLPQLTPQQTAAAKFTVPALKNAFANDSIRTITIRPEGARADQTLLVVHRDLDSNGQPLLTVRDANGKEYTLTWDNTETGNDPRSVLRQWGATIARGLANTPFLGEALPNAQDITWDTPITYAQADLTAAGNLADEREIRANLSAGTAINAIDWNKYDPAVRNRFQHDINTHYATEAKKIQDNSGLTAGQKAEQLNTLLATAPIQLNLASGINTLVQNTLLDAVRSQTTTRSQFDSAMAALDSLRASTPLTSPGASSVDLVRRAVNVVDSSDGVDKNEVNAFNQFIQDNPAVLDNPQVQAVTNEVITAINDEYGREVTRTNRASLGRNRTTTEEASLRRLRNQSFNLATTLNTARAKPIIRDMQATQTSMTDTQINQQVDAIARFWKDRQNVELTDDQKRDLAQSIRTTPDMQVTDQELTNLATYLSNNPNALKNPVVRDAFDATIARAERTTSNSATLDSIAILLPESSDYTRLNVLARQSTINSEESEELLTLATNLDPRFIPDSNRDNIKTKLTGIQTTGIPASLATDTTNQLAQLVVQQNNAVPTETLTLLNKLAQNNLQLTDTEKTQLGALVQAGELSSADNAKYKITPEQENALLDAYFAVQSAETEQLYSRQAATMALQGLGLDTSLQDGQTAGATSVQVTYTNSTGGTQTATVTADNFVNAPLDATTNQRTFTTTTGTTVAVREGSYTTQALNASGGVIIQDYTNVGPSTPVDVAGFKQREFIITENGAEQRGMLLSVGSDGTMTFILQDGTTKTTFADNSRIRTLAVEDASRQSSAKDYFNAYAVQQFDATKLSGASAGLLALITPEVTHGNVDFFGTGTTADYLNPDGTINYGKLNGDLTSQMNTDYGFAITGGKIRTGNVGDIAGATYILRDDGELIIAAPPTTPGGSPTITNTRIHDFGAQQLNTWLKTSTNIFGGSRNATNFRAFITQNANSLDYTNLLTLNTKDIGLAGDLTTKLSSDTNVQYRNGNVARMSATSNTGFYTVGTDGSVTAQTFDPGTRTFTDLPPLTAHQTRFFLQADSNTNNGLNGLATTQQSLTNVDQTVRNKDAHKLDHTSNSLNNAHTAATTALAQATSSLQPAMSTAGREQIAGQTMPLFNLETVTEDDLRNTYMTSATRASVVAAIRARDAAKKEKADIEARNEQAIQDAITTEKTNIGNNVHASGVILANAAANRFANSYVHEQVGALATENIHMDDSARLLPTSGNSRSAQIILGMPENQVGQQTRVKASGGGDAWLSAFTLGAGTFDPVMTLHDTQTGTTVVQEFDRGSIDDNRLIREATMGSERVRVTGRNTDGTYTVKKPDGTTDTIPANSAIVVRPNEDAVNEERFIRNGQRIGRTTLETRTINGKPERVRTGGYYTYADDGATTPSKFRVFTGDNTFVDKDTIPVPDQGLGTRHLIKVGAATAGSTSFNYVYDPAGGDLLRVNDQGLYVDKDGNVLNPNALATASDIGAATASDKEVDALREDLKKKNPPQDLDKIKDAAAETTSGRMGRGFLDNFMQEAKQAFRGGLLSGLNYVSGDLIAGYDHFKGLSQIGSLFIDQAHTDKRRKQMMDKLCDNFKITSTECIIKEICTVYLDNAVIGSTIGSAGDPDKWTGTGTYIAATKSRPVQYINATTGVNVTEWIYRVQLRLKAPADQDIHYNLVWTDKQGRTYNWWATGDQTVKAGGSASITGANSVIAYKKGDYTRVCLVTSPQLRNYDNKPIGQFCRTFEDTGGPTTGYGQPGSGTGTAGQQAGAIVPGSSLP